QPLPAQIIAESNEQGVRPESECELSTSKFETIVSKYVQKVGNNPHYHDEVGDLTCGCLREIISIEPSLGPAPRPGLSLWRWEQKVTNSAAKTIASEIKQRMREREQELQEEQRARQEEQRARDAAQSRPCTCGGMNENCNRCFGSGVLGGISGTLRPVYHYDQSLPAKRRKRVLRPAHSLKTTAKQANAKPPSFRGVQCVTCHAVMKASRLEVHQCRPSDRKKAQRLNSCPQCGQWVKKLARHLRKAHGPSSDNRSTRLSKLPNLAPRKSKAGGQRKERY